MPNLSQTLSGNYDPVTSQGPISSYDIDASLPDDSIAQSGLDKLSNGMPINGLSPQEKAAIGKLSPDMVAYAQAKYAAKKQNENVSNVTNMLAPFAGTGRGVPVNAVKPLDMLQFPPPDQTNDPEKKQAKLPSGNDTLSRYYQSLPASEKAKMGPGLDSPHPQTDAPAPPAPPSTSAPPQVAPTPQNPVGAVLPTPPITPAQPITKIADNLRKFDGSKVANILADALDAVGVSLSARGGVQRETRLQSQLGLQRQTEAQRQQQQNQANIEYDQAIRMLPAEAQQQIQVARAKGDIDTQQAILQSNGLLSNNMKLIMTQANAELGALRNAQSVYQGGAGDYAYNKYQGTTEGQ